MIASVVAWLAASIAGGCAALLAWPDDTPPDLFARTFAMHREDGSAVHVTEAAPLVIPQWFGDCNLSATVELSEGSELDLLFRQVEPRPRDVQHAAGAAVIERELVPFHGRFHLLRMSTRESGPPYRSRESALFDDDVRGGYQLGAGLAATIEMELRGRKARAFVAGVWLPWVEVADEWGAFSFVARGGQALVRTLEIVPRDAGSYPRWSLGALIGALVGGVLLLLRAGPRRTLGVVALCLPAGGWLAHAMVLGHLFEWARPSDAGLVLAVSVGGPLAIALGMRPRWLAVVGLAASVGLLELTVRQEAPRLEPLEDARLDVHFGPASGTGPFDALARRVRSESRIHTLDGDHERILFLGGAPMFEARPALDEQLGLRAAIAVKHALRREVEGVVVATPLAHSLQQLQLFRRFLGDFAPKVVVLGITPLESMSGQRARARVVFNRSKGGTSRSWSALADLWRATREGDDPISTPADLEQTLAELAKLCRARGIGLVLATQPGTEPRMVAAAERFARLASVPLVRNVLTEEGQPRLDELVDAIVGAM